MVKENFFKSLGYKNLTFGSNLCVGIDPHFENLPPFFAKALSNGGAQEFLKAFSVSLIDAASGRVSSVKLQSAFFEAFGEEGLAALKFAINYAHGKGLFCILDVKRCDISSSMKAYGTMAFEYMEADAITVVPFMGVDVLGALLKWLQNGKGAYIVWQSSNREAKPLQALVAKQILVECARWQKKNRIKDALGLVLGATRISDLPKPLIQKASGYPLLLPGVGFQGGKINKTIIALLKKSPASLIPMSRAISMIGDPALEYELRAISSWSEYTERVRKLILAR